jgi:hypothetical protein
MHTAEKGTSASLVELLIQTFNGKTKAIMKKAGSTLLDFFQPNSSLQCLRPRFKDQGLKGGQK